MAEIILDIVLKNAEAASNLTEMKKSVKDLQSALTQLDPNSKEFEAAAKAAGNLKDKIEDASEAAAGMKGQGTVEGITSSFGRLQDKLQNLDFEGVSREMLMMGTAVKSIKLSEMASQLNAVIGNLVKMSAAILTSPIGILAAAVGALVGAYYMWGDAIFGASEKQKVLNKIGEEAVATYAKEAAQLATLVSTYEKSNKSLDDKKNLVDELNSKYGKYLDYKVDENASEEELYTALVKTNKEMEKKAVNLAKEKLLAETYEELIKKQIAFNQLQKSGMDDKFGLGAEIKDLEEKLRILKETNIDLSEGNADQMEFSSTLLKVKYLIKNRHKEEKKEVKDLKKEYVEMSTELTKANSRLSEFDIAKWYKEQYEKILNTNKEVKLEFIKTSPLTFKDTYQENLDELNFVFEVEKTGWGERNRMLKKAYEEDKITFEQYQQSKLNTQQKQLEYAGAVTSGIKDLVSNLAQFEENTSKKSEAAKLRTAKRYFNIGKVLSATEAGISTIATVQKTMKEPTLPFPSNVIMAAVLGAAGAANVAMILSKKFPESASEVPSGDGGATSVSTPSLPSSSTLFNSGGGTPTVLTPFGTTNVQNASAQKVFVVESDITNTQANVQKIGVKSSW